MGYGNRLSPLAWQSAITLAYLVRAGLPLTFTTMGAALGVDHTQLHHITRRLEALGAIDREPLPDVFKGRRQSSYKASRLVRMASSR